LKGVKIMAKVNPNEDFENVKYRKKKNKKTPAKSNHKHNFVPFIAYAKDKSFNKDHYFIAEECSICQKRRVISYFVTLPKKDDRPFRQMASGLEQIKEVYPDYEVKDWGDYIF
jgi:hypothetical protein